MYVKHTKNSILSKKYLVIVILLTTLCIIEIFVSIILQSIIYNKSLEKTEQARLLTASTIKVIFETKEAKRKEPVYILLPNANKFKAIIEDYSLPNSIWALVNKTNSIPTDYIPESLVIPDVATRLDKSNDERSVRSDIAPAVVELFSAAKNDGYELMIGSGYRSAALQSIYFYSLANTVGEVQANISIARPGESEHQTGLAIDISTISYECYLDNCFEYTNGGQWLANNAHKYGFILRYPKNKTDITGYMYESWHFRYVGIDLATALYQSELTLEEAWPYLEKALITLKNNGAI